MSAAVRTITLPSEDDARQLDDLIAVYVRAHGMKQQRSADGSMITLSHPVHAGPTSHGVKLDAIAEPSASAGLTIDAVMGQVENLFRAGAQP